MEKQKFPVNSNGVVLICTVNIEMAKSKTGKIAAISTAIAFFFTILAFTTPNWLESDGKLDDPKFSNLGTLKKEIGVASIAHFNVISSRVLYYFVNHGLIK